MPWTRPLGARTLAVLPFVVLAAGCAFVTPRFPQEVAASFARDDMRKMQTPSAEIYYPAKGQASVERIAARMNQCLETLRTLPKTQEDRGRALLFFTSANFNNAYVTGKTLGEPLHSLLPLHMTLEIFHWSNLGVAEVGDVGCHELVHLVQLEQADGVWGALNWFFGDLLAPNAFTERWFLEGLAQYYEGRLGKPLGRPHSAFERGAFEAIVAERGGPLEPGDLSEIKRELYPFSGAYLTGLHFVEYLARTYGEEKLWELVDRQGHSVGPPFIVTLRFRSVFGKSIGALLEDYSDELQKTVRRRPRPGSQRVLDADLGYLARLAGSPGDGAMAVLSVGQDRVTQLAIHEHDGSLRFARPLTLFAPGRRWQSANPVQVSGMSFTADARWLYLMNDDLTADGDSEAQLWKVDTADGEVVKIWEGLHGLGGGVSPDGGRYVFVELGGDTSNLVELDLGSGRRQRLTDFTGRVTLAAPSYAPDGQRIAFSRFGDHGFDLYLRDADGAVRRLTQDEAFNYAPKWIDSGHLLFARVRDGHVQAHSFELASGQIAPVSAAPYAILDPVPIGGGAFAFVNRDGWKWTLDAAEIAPVAAAGAPDSTQPPPSAAAPEAERPPRQASLQIESDEPYSQLDHLFVPTLHAPFALFVPVLDQSGPDPRISGVDAQLFLSLRGQDRLGFHQWAINGQYNTASSDNAFAFEYGNQLLAPWFAKLHLERGQSSASTLLAGSLEVSRSVWTTPISFSAVALDLSEAATEVRPSRHSRLVGPGAAFNYFASEGTLYGGTKRALGLAGSLNLYPAFLGSDFGMTDVGAQVTLAPHLPILLRHSLVATVRGRALWGAPAGLLQVGGIPRGDVIASVNPTEGESAPDILLPGVAFGEPLRGFEDHAVRATSAAVATARYRYPFIIDSGWASTFYLLPALFVRQIDLEAFGTAAYTDNPSATTLRAAGGAIFVRSAISYVPLSLYYQVAARFDQGLPPLHLVGVSME